MSRRFFLVLSMIGWLLCVAGIRANEPSRVAGTWQISWEARLGMERGTLQLTQKGAKLTGTFHGHGAPCIVTGTIDGSDISFDLNFQAKPKYTLSFTGRLDGDKMNGKFEIAGMKDGYDSHGENVTSTDYTWTAVRQSDQTQPDQKTPPASSDTLK
jgi:hypothetical protein